MYMLIVCALGVCTYLVTLYNACLISAPSCKPPAPPAGRQLRQRDPSKVKVCRCLQIRSLENLLLCVSQLSN